MDKVKKSPTPDLPARGDSSVIYIVIFTFLLIGCLVMISLVLDVWYKEHQCIIEPNFWCSDEYFCSTGCQGPVSGGINSCYYEVTGPTGLASCLYGPSSTGATACMPKGNLTPTTPTCACDYGEGGISSANRNCLYGCPNSGATKGASKPLTVTNCKCYTGPDGKCSRNPKPTPTPNS